MIAKLAVVLSCGCVPLLAQNTWTVGLGGTWNFPDLASALASPSVLDGDTLVYHTLPGGGAANGFTTNKGVTILGATGLALVLTLPPQPIEVNGLPAGRTFRMAGFSYSGVGAIDIRVVNCAGDVHFERMYADEPAWFFPSGPSIVVDNSASVTMRDLENFGAPAVQCNASRLCLVSCRLGVTSNGLAGGPALHATNSTVDIVQPNFDSGWVGDCVVSTNSALRIAGDATSRLSGGIGTPIVTTGGTVFVDPAVPMPSVSPGPAITGTAVVTVGSVPGTWVNLPAGFPGTATVRSTAAPGAALFQAFGVPGPLTSTPLGTLGLDPLQWYAFFPPAVVPPTGVVTNTVPVPALPPGTAFATQSVVWNGALLELGSPATFVVY